MTLHEAAVWLCGCGAGAFAGMFYGWVCGYSYGELCTLREAWRTLWRPEARDGRLGRPSARGYGDA